MYVRTCLIELSSGCIISFEIDVILTYLTIESREGWKSYNKLPVTANKVSTLTIGLVSNVTGNVCRMIECLESRLQMCIVHLMACGTKERLCLCITLIKY